MASRRAFLATAASVGVAGCVSSLDPPPVLAAAATGKRVDGRVEGSWEPVARCEPAQGHGFDYGATPVDVPLTVTAPGSTDGDRPEGLPESGPLVVDGSLLEGLRESYDRLRFGVVLTAIERNTVHDREPGTETVYWVARGEFNRIAVGDRVRFRPSESDENGLRSVVAVQTVRDDRV